MCHNLLPATKHILDPISLTKLPACTYYALKCPAKNKENTLGIL